MRARVAMLVALVGLATVACTKSSETAGSDASAFMTASASASATASAVLAPPPAPVVTATVTATATATASPTATVTAHARPPAVTPFERAKEAALAGRLEEVRTLLMPVAKAGRATPDELRLLRQACRTLNDKACLALTK